MISDMTPDEIADMVVAAKEQLDALMMDVNHCLRRLKMCGKPAVLVETIGKNSKARRYTARIEPAPWRASR